MPLNRTLWPHEREPKGSGETERETIDPLAGGIQPNGWAWLGPGNIGGRVRSILIHPTNPSVMWAGGVSGGIWKTTNGGQSWFPLNDFLPSLAVSCMAMDPANPNIIYAGTGESAGSQSDAPGAGIFKSTNGGTTWTQLPSTTDEFDWEQVNRIATAPFNGQVILAATSSGIFRSTDGGTSWTRSLSNEMMDVNFQPGGSSGCVAGGPWHSGGAYYSLDGGVSWSQATGLPGTGRVEVAYAPNNPSIVYASVDANGGELYRSTDGGQHYVLRNTGTTYFRHSPQNEGSQGWYDNALWVDPTNSNIVIVGGIDLWRSTDAGATLTRISLWWDAPNSAHADHHVIVEHPAFNGSTNKTVYFGNDGGVYRTSNVYTVINSTGWVELNNNLGVTQFYGAAGNATSGVIIGGTQDNGTLSYSGGTETWKMAAGGDGGKCASDPTDPNYFYGEFQYLGLHRSTDGGVTSQSITNGLTDAFGDAMFVAPFVLDPNNSNTLIAGGARLWRSTNVKATTPSWAVIKPYVSGTGYVTSVAVAKGNSNLIWVGQNLGEVYRTANGTAANPTWTRVNSNSPGLPDRFPTSITIDPNNHSRVFVTFGGFSPDNVWLTTNGGQTWSDISGNLPDAPVYTFAIWPQNPNWLYVGTEIGVFASEDGGATWSPSNEGPANTGVDELFWMDDTLVAATHGRGLYKINVAANNEPPTVGITNIADGSSFPAPATIQVNASASDSDGTINRVDFYVNNSLIGSDTTLPYGVTWSNAPAGDYDLTAKATDNDGGSTVSSAVSVTVYTPHSISGRVTDGNGNGVSAVTMSLRRGSTDYETKLTDAGGNYSFVNLPPGDYDLTPLSGDYVFSPESQSFPNLDSNQTADFIRNGDRASYDATLKAPKCGQPGSVCDSGTLLNGRGTMTNGQEPNQPNTINNSCADGASGTYHVDESLDAIKISTLDGSDFAPGKTVRLEVTFWVWSTSEDYLDLFYAADATNPNWVHLTTFQPANTGKHVLATSYDLPAGGSLQAVRAKLRYQGSASPCDSTNSDFDDHDDLIFATSPEAAESVVWTNAVGVSVAGNSISKPTTASEGWDAGAFSSKAITSGDGYVEFTVAAPNAYKACGLSRGNMDQSLADIDFALHNHVNGSVYVIERGVSRGVVGTYVAGDKFRVAVEGGKVKYRKNGTLLYTSTLTPTYPLLADASLYTLDARINNAVIHGNLTGDPVEPGVATKAASIVTNVGAWLNGSINPNGTEASVWFEWGTSPVLSGASSTAPQNIGAGSLGMDVSAPINNLSPNTTYYFRVAGSNDGGPARGKILRFATGSKTSLVINDALVTEGNTGTSAASFTVNLSTASTQEVRVSYQTANGSALAGKDYQTTQGQLIFSPGQTSKSVTVLVIGDVLDEANETFRVNLSAPINAGIADAQAVGTITDNELPPKIRINSVAVTEPNAGANVSASFTVNLTAASGQTVTVKYATANGSAQAPADYTATPLTTLTFSPGQTSKTVTVQVRGDTLDEVNETFKLMLSSATNATFYSSQGVCTITDNDPPPSISISNATVNEPDSGTINAVFTVTLSAVSGRAVSVKYQTAPGTATSGVDYTALALSTLTFQPGQTARTINVQVKGDTVRESNETFFINLSGAGNAAIADAQGAGTILNDD